MKKHIVVTLALAIVFNMLFPIAAVAQKSLEVTITGYTLLYQAYMEALGQKTSLRREWITDDQAMIYLTDTCFCMVTAESKSDFSNITEVLHTAAPESDSDMLAVRCSMVATILAFDPDLDVDTITQLVMKTLPEKGEYASDYCTYKYTQSYNVIMLTIYPK